VILHPTSRKMPLPSGAQAPFGDTPVLDGNWNCGSNLALS
jgi:hypothetical protein